LVHAVAVDVLGVMSEDWPCSLAGKTPCGGDSLKFMATDFQSALRADFSSNAVVSIFPAAVAYGVPSRRLLTP
jgi:hypothetical protein